MAVSWMVSDPFYSEGVGHLVNPTNGRSCEKNIGHRFTRMRQIKQKDKSRASKLFIPLIRLIRVHLWLTSSYFSQLRQWVDASDPFYNESPVRGLKSHQRELVDGSDPLYTESLLRLKFLTARISELQGTVEEGI